MLALASLLAALAEGRSAELFWHARRTHAFAIKLGEVLFVIWVGEMVLVQGFGLSWSSVGTAAVLGAILFAVPAAARDATHWYAARRGR